MSYEIKDYLFAFKKTCIYVIYMFLLKYERCEIVLSIILDICSSFNINITIIIKRTLSFKKLYFSFILTPLLSSY